MKGNICGIDEAGRGALAGPLVGAAVILPCSIRKLRRVAKTPIRDGKTLTTLQRQRICRALKGVGAEIHIEAVSCRRINNRGIQRANREAVRNLIKRVDADRYVVDGSIRIGRIKGKTDRVQCVVNADATIVPVVLAGIVAKVHRDRIMRQLHRQFPRYRWFSNKGYGTLRHLRAIEAFGTTRYHRNVFVSTAIKLPIFRPK